MQGKSYFVRLRAMDVCGRSDLSLEWHQSGNIHTYIHTEHIYIQKFIHKNDERKIIELFGVVIWCVCVHLCMYVWTVRATLRRLPRRSRAIREQHVALHRHNSPQNWNNTLYDGTSSSVLSIYNTTTKLEKKEALLVVRTSDHSSYSLLTHHLLTWKRKLCLLKFKILLTCTVTMRRCVRFDLFFERLNFCCA